MILNTFDEVVNWYNITKPVVSKHHKAEDNIRPIGSRKRKWERILKVDAETYCLLDGLWSWHSGEKQAKKQYEQDMAPIMWKREADGDYIYIRNGVIGSVPIARYKFLQWYLPTGLRFRSSQQGKHGVSAKTPTGYEDFPLPKTAYRWEYPKGAATEDDGKRLRFKVNGDGTFTREGEQFTVTVKQIDRERKKQWKPMINAFYDHAGALASMLDTSYESRTLYGHMITEWSRENMPNSVFNYSPWGRNGVFPQELARAIVADEAHPMRVPLMALVVYEIGGKRPVTSQDVLREIRAAFNRKMNTLLGMYETKEI